MATALSPKDRLALADLAARYAQAVDTRDFDRLRDVFIPEGTLDTGRSIREGIDAVIDAMQGLLAYKATSHMLGQQVIDEVDGGINGVTYCTAHHLTDHGDHRTDKVMHIQYHDRFVQTEDGWRIATRRLDVLWTDEKRVG